MSTTGLWKPYCPTRKVGKLCSYLCTEESEFPVRDIRLRCGCAEPNYETATYNWYAECNQGRIRTAVREGRSHILFVTRYKGKQRRYVNRSFIVGYYEIGWIAETSGRTAIKAKNLCFVPIEHACEFPVDNLRWLPGDIVNLDEIVQHLDRHNRVDDYLLEVDRLKATHNPKVDYQ